MPRRLQRYKPRKIGKLYAATSTHAYGESWPAFSLMIRKRDNYRCRIGDVTGGRRRCTNRFPPPFHHLLHVHHLLERTKGGADTGKNCITICCVCHGWLHNKPLGTITLKQLRAAQRIQ